MRWVYISPHLDDIIFSAGGLIYEQAQKKITVEIWNVMSGFPEQVELSPFAKAIHHHWGTNSAEEAMRVRRTENEDATKIVGAKNRYLNFVDSLYRTKSDGHALYINSFSPLHEDEKELPHQVAEEISKHHLPDDILVCPLALGGHIDHVIVREAIELLDISPFYIADIPYLLGNHRTLWGKTLGMKKSAHKISKIGLEYWLKAILAYDTQINIEFGTAELMQKNMTAYWKKNNGIRLWKKR